MAKDARGITIKVGDEIFFNGCTCTVVSIKESGLVSSSAIVGNKAVAQAIPGVVEVSMKINYIAGQPITNLLVLGCPKDIDIIEAKRNSQA